MKKLLFLLWLLPSCAWALTEVPGNGVDDDASGGDQACASPDADCDGYASDGSSGLDGKDCDDTNRRIFPGVEVWTSGTSWKTCQADGTYSSIGNSCPDHNCYYVDPTSGNDANAGTSAAAAFQHLTMLSYYASGAPSGNKHSALACGDHIYLLPGTYNAGQSHAESGFGRVGLLIKDKSCLATPITIHFIGAAVLDTLGTSASPNDGSAIWIENSPGTIVKGNTAGEIKNIVSADTGTEKGAIKIRTSQSAVLRGLSIHNNHGHGNYNASAIYVSDSDSLSIDHNDVYDQVCDAGNCANICLFIGFNGTTDRLYLNSFRYTSGATTNCGVKQKHGGSGLTWTADHNLSSNMPGFVSGASINNFNHNLLSDLTLTNSNTCGGDYPAAFASCDLGAPVYSNGANTISYNTVNVGYFSGHKPVNFTGSWSEDHNVVRDNRASYGTTAAIVNMDNYGSDANYTGFITGGRYTTNNNCWSNAGAGTLQWSFYGWTSGGGSNPAGAFYTFAQLQSNGYCATCSTTNPTFNTKLEATAGACSTYGWNVNWLSSLGSGWSGYSGGGGSGASAPPTMTRVRNKGGRRK